MLHILKPYYKRSRISRFSSLQFGKFPFSNENPITYIPAEMTLLPKNKIGMSVGWQTKRGRGKVLR